MNIIRSFFIAFSMYSKIPMPKTDWTKEAMKYALCFFPAVGIVIGIVTIGWMYLAAQLGFGDLFRTAVLLLIPVAISGGIHLDGLLDTADALSSWKTMEEKLEILKDSHAGAFAIIVGISYFVLYFGILSEVQLADVLVLAVGFVLSRALSAFAMVTFRLAKNTGLAATFSDMAVKGRVRVVMLVIIPLCCLAMLFTDPIRGCGAILGACLAFLYYRHMAYKKFGGITGDLAGFFLQLCELMMALGVVIVDVLI